jgi:predicted DNA-binding antitoxin AbrB/MazE fold protein
VRPVKALYENGLLRPAKPLPLRSGERVALIVVRQPDPARWDLNRLGAAATEDEALATAGLADWADALDHQDKA